ncbi:MAG: type II toxin-antitoxin system HicA family toxin [Candidatus Thiodiazotropha sp. (ex Epidulcina cf. delphinae)]|nr:type II toxin-antitoxin system HicA family toxin [Candidatus Thiodiazotropha sp. (ex Epidulcina cf. delphinae)]
MAKRVKSIERIKQKPKDYKWREAESLLSQLGYTKLEGAGSRIKFVHDESKHIISLHKPHPNPEMDPGAIKDLYNSLKDQGLL